MDLIRFKTLFFNLGFRNDMKYTSKQVQIFKPASMIFNTLSSFDNFSSFLGDKVQGWSAHDNRCTFEMRGIKIGLRFDELVPNSIIKIVGDDGATPFPFTMWIQLKEMSEGVDHSVAQVDTRLRIVIDVELNMMMKMLIGGKIQGAIDSIAEHMAHSFNSIK